MDIAMITMGFYTAGLVLALNGAVQLAVRKKTGPWKEGGTNLLTGGIIAGVAVGVPLGLAVKIVTNS